MKKKIFVFGFFVSFLLVFSSFLFAQTITITNPTSESKWCGTQTIEWSVDNKTEEFRGITPPGDPGYYKIFYAPEGTPPITTPWGFGPDPSYPWVIINADVRDDGEEVSSYSLNWDTWVASDGNYIILIAAYNPDGECVSVSSQTFLVDNTLPTISVSYTPEVGERTNGWWNLHNAPIEVKITVSDAHAGVKEIRYKVDSGSETTVSVSGSPSSYDCTFTATEGTTLYIWADDTAENKDGENNTASNEFPDYKVDLTPPTITINVDYAKKTFTLDVEEATSGISNRTYSFNGSDWLSYTGETPIPEGTTQIMTAAVDNAGNIGTSAITFSTNRKISGYVKDYKGNLLTNVKVQLAGDTINTTTTNSSGYYEFTGLDDFGNYYVFPLLKNNMPYARIYEGLGEDKTQQNFVVVDGWLSKNYDRGRTNDYQFASSSSIISPPVLVESYSLSLSGTSLLTGVLNDDNNMDILFTDGNYLRGYYWTGTAYTRRDWLPQTTTYNISLLDGTEGEIQLDCMVLCGTGTEIAQLFDKDGTKIKDINTNVLSSDLDGVKLQKAPPDTEWSASFGIGKARVLFTGAGTDYNAVFLYDFLNDTTLCETTLSQQIIPGTETLCLREAGKPAVIIGSQSDEEDLKLVAIDIETGHSLWEKTFTGIRGQIKPIVAPIEEGGWDKVIAVRTSTDSSSGEMKVYVLDGATGDIIMEWTAPTIITPVTNKSFTAAVGDLDNDGIKELVIADSSGNIYIINLSTGSYIYALNKGKVWALLDFDGASDGKKEIVVSSGTEIKILKADLTTLVSRDMEENIINVVVSDTNGDNYPDIVVSLPSKISVLRAGITTDLPAKPVIVDIYSTAGNVYLVWSYTSNGADLSGFKIYRSSNPSDDSSWEEIDTVEADVNLFQDSPPAGIYSYKVAAYNDYGEKRSNASTPVEVVSVESEGGSSSCFIATAAFGTPLAKEVKILCRWRDEVLMKRWIGRKFVKFYYKISPPIAEFIRKDIVSRAIVRILLKPIVLIVKLRFSMPLFSSLILTTLFLFPFLLLFIKREVKNEE